MIKYTIPKIYKSNNYWYVYFLYEGKEFRFSLHYNKIQDLKEKQIYFEELAKVILEDLKMGWNPNVTKEDNLFLGMFTDNEVIQLISSLDKDNQHLKLNSKHPNIFYNNGFALFEHILNTYIKPINTKGRQSDLIYYYWKMYDNEPQYIHQRPTEFFNWFENNYDEVFGQLKTLSQVETPQRNKDFSNALDWFKQQPQQVP
jgi:hypothetical protein